MDTETLVGKMDRLKQLNQEFGWVKVWLRSLPEDDRVGFFFYLKAHNAQWVFERVADTKTRQAGLLMLEIAQLRQELKVEYLNRKRT